MKYAFVLVVALAGCGVPKERVLDLHGCLKHWGQVPAVAMTPTQRTACLALYKEHKAEEEKWAAANPPQYSYRPTLDDRVRDIVREELDND